MDGCVPDSIRYVPGLRLPAVQVSPVVAPAATSVAKDCTRTPCAGGAPAGPGTAIGQVTCWALVWSGDGAVVLVIPRPPPNCPTITSEVGTPLAPKFRLLV